MYVIYIPQLQGTGAKLYALWHKTWGVPYNYHSYWMVPGTVNPED